MDFVYASSMSSYLFGEVEFKGCGMHAYLLIYPWKHLFFKSWRSQTVSSKHTDEQHWVDSVGFHVSLCRGRKNAGKLTKAGTANS